jgi:hypothetical protein
MSRWYPPLAFVAIPITFLLAGRAPANPEIAAKPPAGDIVATASGNVATASGNAIRVIESDPDLAILQDLVRRGNTDEAILPEIRAFLDRRPDFCAKLSDLAYATDFELAGLAGRGNVMLTETYLRRVSQMRTELASPESTPLERLLVANLCTCWLASCEAEVTARDGIDRLPGRADFLDRRRNRAHRRYQYAVKNLALVRKLLTPARSPLDFAAVLDASANRRAATSPQSRHRKPASTLAN